MNIDEFYSSLDQNSNELSHYKYTRKYRKNGKWRYVYDDNSKSNKSSVARRNQIDMGSPMTVYEPTSEEKRDMESRRAEEERARQAKHDKEMQEAHELNENAKKEIVGTTKAVPGYLVKRGERYVASALAEKVIAVEDATGIGHDYRKKKK